MPDTITQDRYAIECRGLWKVFGARAQEAIRATKDDGWSKRKVFETLGCTVAVSDVSLRVARGEVFCIIGLSGSGKSTVLRHINGLIEPTAGEMLINGLDIARQSRADVRRLRSARFGMVFQDFALLPHRSVLQNIAFGLELRGEPLEKRTHIAEQKMALVGLQGWGDARTDELSGGMQQRVGIARALASDPEILLMDEPFSALDPLIRRQLQDQFIELSHGMHKTTVFITHDLEEAMRVGHRIAIMRDGRVVQVGKPADILLAPADDYVASFIGGLSPMHVLSVGDICVDFTEPALRQRGEGPHVLSSTRLVDAIDICLAHDGPIAVLDSGNQVMGQIDRALLLSSVKPSGSVPHV